MRLKRIVQPASILFALQWTLTGCEIPAELISPSSSEGDSVTLPSMGPHGRSGFRAEQIEGISVAWWSHYLIDSGDNVYVPDTNENGVLKYSPDGSTTRFFAGHNAAVIAKDASDSIYVFVGAANHSGGSPAASSLSIQKISSAGVVSLLCNSTNCQSAASGGFYWSGAVDSVGNLYFPYAKWSGHTYLNSFIAKVSPTGAFSVFAGSFGNDCKDGSLSNAVFSNVRSISIDSSDRIFALDVGEQRGSNSAQSGCNRIRRLSQFGTVSSIHSFSNSTAGVSMVMDDLGNFYYISRVKPEGSGFMIRKLTPSGVEKNLCGSEWRGSTSGSGDCSEVFLWSPSGFGMDFDSAGNLVFNQALYGTMENALFRILKN